MATLLAALAGLPAGWVGAHAIEAWKDRAPLRGAPLPSRNLLVGTVAATAALFAFVAWRRDTEGVALVGLLALTWGLVVGTVIDLRTQRLPDRLTFKLVPLVGLPMVVESIRTGEWGDLGRAGIAAVSLTVGMFALAEGYRLVRGRMGMGMGDVKLSPSLGLGMGWLGLWELVIFLYASVAGAAVVVLGLVVTRRVGLASRIPYGPYLALGAIGVLLGGDPAVEWVVDRLGY